MPEDTSRGRQVQAVLWAVGARHPSREPRRAYPPHSPMSDGRAPRGRGSRPACPLPPTQPQRSSQSSSPIQPALAFSVDWELPDGPAESP